MLSLNQQSSPSDLVRACLEGVVLRLNANLSLMKDKIEDSTYIMASGNSLGKACCGDKCLQIVPGVKW